MVVLASNLPAGAENDPNAPWNNEEPIWDCAVCGTPTDAMDGYCSSECFMADCR